MDREIERELVRWKERDRRTPLIIRGARQVGKSFTVEKFAKSHFRKIISVNFEEKPDLAGCFDDLDVHKIVKKLEYCYDKSIVAGKTLLFFDEVQHCPQALKALRYFKEKLPMLHVIAAGSLLEFILQDEEQPIFFPVGRVKFLNMKPLSFVEYMRAIGKRKWLELFEETSIATPVARELHSHLMQYVRDYFLIGGMPEAVKSYLLTDSYLEAMHEQRALLDLYRLDLIKYGHKKQLRALQRLFERAPHFVAHHFRYSKIDPEASNPSRDYKEALFKLHQAGIIAPVHATAANGLPLKAEENEKKFKLLFLDIGLLQSALEIDPKIFTMTPIHQINAGVLAEQFVGQELIAYADSYAEPHLFFWETEKGGTAEVDYLIHHAGNIIPLEVKAGVNGRQRSLVHFMEKKNSPFGIRVTADPLSFNGEKKILSLPFYLISQLPRFLSSLLEV